MRLQLCWRGDLRGGVVNSAISQTLRHTLTYHAFGHKTGSKETCNRKAPNRLVMKKFIWSSGVRIPQAEGVLLSFCYILKRTATLLSWPPFDLLNLISTAPAPHRASRPNWKSPRKMQDLSYPQVTNLVHGLAVVCEPHRSPQEQEV